MRLVDWTHDQARRNCDADSAMVGKFLIVEFGPDRLDAKDAGKMAYIAVADRTRDAWATTSSKTHCIEENIYERIEEGIGFHAGKCCGMGRDHRVVVRVNTSVMR